MSVKKAVLTKVGLKKVMNTDPQSKDFCEEAFLMDESIFDRYKSKEYLSSGILDTDEVYGFYNVVLLHKATGLRFEYAVCETYTGDAEYKIIEVFIKTLSGEKLQVSDINSSKKHLIALERKIPFDELKYDSKGD